MANTFFREEARSIETVGLAETKHHCSWSGNSPSDWPRAADMMLATVRNSQRIPRGASLRTISKGEADLPRYKDEERFCGWFGRINVGELDEKIHGRCRAVWKGWMPRSSLSPLLSIAAYLTIDRSSDCLYVNMDNHYPLDPELRASPRPVT
jgi:hypothetical protein